jgi:hypothetical protein
MHTYKSQHSGGLRQEDSKFEASLDHIVRPCLQKPKTKQNKTKQKELSLFSLIFI